MFAFIRLTRPVNLAIIVITMCLMRYGVIGGYLVVSSNALRAQAGEGGGDIFPQVPGNTLHHQFSDVLFALLVLSTVLIAAGGNMINDYFDTRIDRINKPDHVIVGRTVKRRVAIAGHLVLSSIGVLIGAFVAWRAGLLKWAIVPLFAAVALWFYSTSLKRAFVVGNGMVALLTAMIPVLVGIYEIPLLERAYATGTQVTAWPAGSPGMLHFNVIWYWLLAYAAFAFLSTLVRELQKDMADIPGDRADGCHTIPIVLGVPLAKALALLYIGVLIIALLLVRRLFLHDTISDWYIGVGIIAPMLISAGFTFFATDRSGHNLAGNVLKAAMVMAVLYAALVRFIL